MAIGRSGPRGTPHGHYCLMMMPRARSSRHSFSCIVASRRWAPTSPCVTGVEVGAPELKRRQCLGAAAMQWLGTQPRVQARPGQGPAPTAPGPRLRILHGYLWPCVWCGTTVLTSNSAGLDPPPCLVKSRTPRVVSLARPAGTRHCPRYETCKQYIIFRCCGETAFSCVCGALPDEQLPHSSCLVC